ncbi:MAG: hypothetical protein AB7F99_06070 [Vicinamibacterales bacterium]
MKRLAEKRFGSLVRVEALRVGRAILLELGAQSSDGRTRKQPADEDTQDKRRRQQNKDNGDVDRTLRCWVDASIRSVP